MKSLHHSSILVRCSSLYPFTFLRVHPQAIQRSKWRAGFFIFLFSTSLLFSQTTLGDVNQDEIININDILRTVNIILEIPPPPSETEQVNADLNVDEAIDISDIIIIVDIILDNLDGYCNSDEWDIPCDTNYSQCCYPITSHEFEWELTEFYDPEFSFNEINVCHILASDNIWCSGEIHDSSSVIDIANFIHYDGNDWELTGYGINPDSELLYPAANSMVFSSDDLIWRDRWSNSYGHWNGDSVNIYENEYILEILPGGVLTTWEKILWGFNRNNMYHTYANGDIFRWDGDEFIYMESPVAMGVDCESSDCEDYGINDIYGHDENNIYALCSKNSWAIANTWDRVLKNDGSNSWEIIYDSAEPVTDSTGLYGWINGIWSFQDTLYLKSREDHKIWKESIQTGGGVWSIHPDSGDLNLGTGIMGNHYNDLFSMNFDCAVEHYNGIDWNWDLQPYQIVEPLGIFYNCYGYTVKDDTIVIWGKSLHSKTFVLIGTRVEG